jgi:hypothetical protein
MYFEGKKIQWLVCLESGYLFAKILPLKYLYPDLKIVNKAFQKLNVGLKVLFHV